MTAILLLAIWWRFSSHIHKIPCFGFGNTAVGAGLGVFVIFSGRCIWKLEMTVESDGCTHKNLLKASSHYLESLASELVSRLGWPRAPKSTAISNYG